MAIERAIGSARSGLLEERGEIGRFSASFFSQDRFGYRPKSILHIVALRNSAFPGKEIGPSRVSFGKLRFLRRSPYHLSRTIPKNSNFFRIVPRYSFAHVFRPILTIYMQVALLENEIFRAINDERKKGRREKRSVTEAIRIAPPQHRHLSFRSSARPNIFRLYNKRSLCSHKLCKSMPRVI